MAIIVTADHRGSNRLFLATSGVALVVAEPSELQAILNAIGGVLGEAPSVLLSDPAASRHRRTT
jgi:hypothetical protein